jgi:hypothetical protein
VLWKKNLLSGFTKNKKSETRKHEQIL